MLKFFGAVPLPCPATFFQQPTANIHSLITPLPDMDSGPHHTPDLKAAAEDQQQQQQLQQVKGILKKATTTQAEENVPRFENSLSLYSVE